MSDLSTRLFTLQRAMGIKQKEKIAEMLSVSRTMLYNYEQGDPEPPRELLLTLERLEREADIEHPFTPILKEDAKAYGASRLIGLIGWAHAGEAESYEELTDTWKKMIPTDCRDLKAFAVTLEGDSMEPKYCEGDVIVVQPSEDPHSGCLVVAKFKNDGVIFRRIEMTGKTITLVPLNHRYETSQHTLEEFSWIYPVWGRWTQVWR